MGRRETPSRSAPRSAARRFYTVVADDLTGAGDTGVQFARAGLKTRSLVGAWDAASLMDVDVVVVNTESRAARPEDAHRAVLQTVRRLLEAGGRPIYKKTDSTLRGNIGAELDALLDGGGVRLAVLCPAFPANARTVVGGFLLVDGQPVARTAIGRDPVSPVRQSHIPALVTSQSRHRVAHISLITVEQGAAAVRQALDGMAAQGPTTVVVDAVSDADLAVIAEAAAGMGEGVLLAGSAGLAQPVATLLAARERRDGAASTSASRSVLMACGSVNPTSRAQLAKLSAQPGWVTVVLDLRAALHGGRAWTTWRDRAVSQAVEAVAAGQSVAVSTPGDQADVETARREGVAAGLSPDQVPAHLARAIADVAVGVATKARDRLAGMVLTGGDTARAVMDRLGAPGVDLLSEVSPGIPYGTISGGSLPGMPVVTKAGGFGKPEALVDAARYLVERA